MKTLENVIRNIITATGRSNAMFWDLARFVRDAQTKQDATYATVSAAWQNETDNVERDRQDAIAAIKDAEANGMKPKPSDVARATESAHVPCPSESSVRQLGASAKLWGSVADGTHSPYHAYAWRALAYNIGDDGKRTPKVGDDLQAAWDSIPSSRPKPKPTAPTATVSVKLPKTLAERLQGMADAAGVDVADVILALLPDA